MSRLDQVCWYTWLSFQAFPIVIGVSALCSAVQGFHSVPVVVAQCALIIASIVASIFLARCPEFSRDQRPLDRQALRPYGGYLLAVWVVIAVVSRSGIAAGVPLFGGDSWRSPGVLFLLLVSVVFTPFLGRKQWWVLAGFVVLSAVVIDREGGVFLFVCVLAPLLNLASWQSLWVLRNMAEIEKSKDTESALKITEERLRFSRDLHDVVGHALSAIAVKSELAKNLVDRNDPRAQSHLREVNEIAQESLKNMREVVQGYRITTVATQIEGARQLLESMALDLQVIGDFSQLPARLDEPISWFIREGVTNVIRHADASCVVLELSDHMVVLRNDGVRGAPGPWCGLTGLRDRLKADHCRLSARQDGGWFFLEARWI